MLPKTLKNLHLTHDLYWKLTGEELKEVFSSLPKDLKSLNLSWNRLCNFSEEELKEALSRLPKDLKILDLQWNEFWEKENEIKQYYEKRWVNVILGHINYF